MKNLPPVKAKGILHKKINSLNFHLGIDSENSTPRCENLTKRNLKNFEKILKMCS